MAVTLKFKCKHCGEPNKVALAMAGRPMPCQHCQAPLVVPVPREPSPEKPGQSNTAVAQAPSRAAAEPRGAKSRAASAGSAPRQSSAPAEEEYVEKAPPLRRLSAEKDPWVAARAAGEDAEAPDKPKKKRKKKRKKKGGPAGLETEEALAAVAVVACVILLAGLVAWAMPGMRSILGLTMVVVGGLSALIGMAAFSNVARQEGDIHYLLCRFVPLYIVYFAIRHWDDVRGHLVFYFAGLAIMMPGLLVWRLAPDFNEDPLPKQEQVNEAPELSYVPAWALPPQILSLTLAGVLRLPAVTSQQPDHFTAGPRSMGCGGPAFAKTSPLRPTLELARSANPKEMSRCNAPLVV